MIVIGERICLCCSTSGSTTYNHGRPDMAPDPVAPDPRPPPATGLIVRELKLLGLVTEYSRAA